MGSSVLPGAPSLPDRHPRPEQRVVLDIVYRRSPSSGTDVAGINQFLQEELRRRERSEVAAVEAARWLDQAGRLNDSEIRRGLPLRNLLRAGLITGQRQEPNHRWFIERVDLR